jgi:uncharacterized protein (TIGR02231 family)
MRIACLAIALSAAPLAAASLRVPSAPAQVTVYPRGAQVGRIGRVDAPAGEQTLVFEGLPVALRPESLRLNLEGPPGSKVYAVRLRQAFSEREVQARRQALEERLRGLSDAKEDLGDRIAAREAEAEILKAVATKAAAGQDAKGLNGLAEGAGAVGRRLAVLAAANRRDRRAQRELDARIKAVQAELEQVGGGAESTRVVEVDVEVPVAGALKAALNYFVDEAGWAPRYDIRLYAAAKEATVEIESLAELTQRSGEDWDAVTLALSTARPNLDSRVPDPTDWWLDYLESGPILQRPTLLKAAAAEAVRSEPAAAVAAEAEVQDLGPATLFKIGRKASIPSDGSAHRVAIGSGRHPVELKLVVVPRLSEFAYLEARIRYQGPQPLLPGPAQLFRDSDLAGDVQLSYNAPGAELVLGFGQDEKVTARRQRRQQKSGGTFFAAKDRVRYDFDILVANHHAGARSVELREQLPRSRQDDIKVEALALEPRPLPEERVAPGLQVWRLNLGPGETRNVRLAYEVRWPEGKRVLGLE